MTYCKRCLLPDTKPYITFDAQGVCNACLAHEKKNRTLEGIDWKKRDQEFERIVETARGRSAPWYDVMVPVSGGKDSISQVHRVGGKGLRILAVNVDYGIKTEVGKHNLALIPKMGASLSIYTPDQTLHRQLILIGLKDFGDPDLLSHTLLYAYPLWLALRFEIPLVVLGENSAFEYGGSPALAAFSRISRPWFDSYVANRGVNARRITEKYNISYEKLQLYDFPDELEKSGTQAVFSSYFFHWDSEENLKIAKTHGFQALPDHGEGTYRNYVGIDEEFNRLHQYLKLLKFGYGRATDHACEDIRNGRLTREEAKKLVRQYDLESLSDRYIRDFAKHLEMTPTELTDIVEKYRNFRIWKKDAQGRWTVSGHLED